MPGLPLRLFNTLTREVAQFEALHGPEVGMYSCGPTVYAYQHIGNMRAYVFADTIKRALLWKGFGVRHVINITDVGHLTSDADEGEDKLELAARREGRNAWQVADYYTGVFKQDVGRLRVLEPDVWCKATDHIRQMINFAADLEADGWCYALPSGLYLDTSKDRDYGRLSRLDLAGQREGARVEAVEGKRNPSDFAVWRTSARGENRQMEWESPWGRGTPGWHLECSVMSIQYLGRHFQIMAIRVSLVPPEWRRHRPVRAVVADPGPVAMSRSQPGRLPSGFWVPRGTPPRSAGDAHRRPRRRPEGQGAPAAQG